jgi:hypothetical protein
MNCLLHESVTMSRNKSPVEVPDTLPSVSPERCRDACKAWMLQFNYTFGLAAKDLSSPHLHECATKLAENGIQLMAAAEERAISSQVIWDFCGRIRVFGKSGSKADFARVHSLAMEMCGTITRLLIRVMQELEQIATAPDSGTPPIQWPEEIPERTQMVLEFASKTEGGCTAVAKAIASATGAKWRSVLSFIDRKKELQLKDRIKERQAAYRESLDYPGL